MKKGIALFLALIFTASAYGCAGGGGSGTENDSAEVKGEAVGEQRVLTFNTNSWAAPQNVPGLAEAFAKWEKENNAKLEITLSTDDYLPKLLQDINAGNVADVAFVDASNVVEVNATGAIISLEKWYTPELRAEHYPYAAEGCIVDGVPKIVWFHAGLWNLYYRKDLLEAAGYKEPPKDWDELLEMGAKLTKDEDSDGVIDVYALGVPGFRDAVTVCTFLPFYWGHGKDIKLTDGKDKVLYGEGKDFDAMYDTMTFIQKMIADGVVSPDMASTKFTDVEANFVGGQTAMAILGNWHYPLMQASGGEEFMANVGIADIPAVPGQESVTTAGGWGMCMFAKDPEQQELAWSFMNFYRSAEVQTLFTKIGQMTSLLSVYEQPEFKDDPAWQAFSQGLYGGRTRDAVPFYSAVDQQFQFMIQQAATTEEDMAQFIKDSAAEAQAVADSMK